VEVWDGRDGLRMLSAEGRLQVIRGGEIAMLRVTGSDRHEVVGPAFSAASRDPEHHRFDDIENYFLHADLEGRPAELCTRVVVRDVRSGRRAVLWDTGKRQRWTTDQVPPTDDYAPFLPEGSLYVGTFGDRSTVYPPCGTGEAAIKMRFSFYVRPEAGQEGVPARDKLWRLGGADAEQNGEHHSTLYMYFRTGDTVAIGNIVWSSVDRSYRSKARVQV
jgi:hypothetical protein